MDFKGPKVFLLFLNLTFVCNFYVLAKIHPSTNAFSVNDSSLKLTTFSPISKRKLNGTFTTRNDHSNHKHQNSWKGFEIYAATYKHTNFFSPNEDTGPNENRNVDSNSELHHRSPSTSPNSPSDSPKKKQTSSRRLFDKRLSKRSTDNRNPRKNMPREKQRKAKVLGRLLMNNPVNKNDQDIQDDYTEDEVDDYFRGVNKKKMNWEAFQNEDGSSVMELIALNARHKINTYPVYDE